MIKNIKKTIYNHYLLSSNIYKFGSDMHNKLLLLILPFYLLLTKKLSFKKRILYKINIKYNGKSASINFSSWADLVAFKEVFVEKQYEPITKEYPKVIFDLGSHVGMSILYFSLCFPRAKIYGFEPDPNNFSLLKLNTAPLSQVRVFNKAISNVNEEVVLFHGNSSSITSSLKFRHARSVKETSVEVITLDAAFEQLNIDKIDILKFDIEGSEEEVFSTGNILDKINYVVGELHCDLTKKGKKEFESIFKKTFKHVVLESIANERYIVKAWK